jgi:hypothetical protein
MSDPRAQRNLARQLEQARVTERPGGVSGFSTFFETGSFTPTLVGSGTAGTFTYTANANLVEWSRIGNRVFFNGRVNISAIGVAPVGNMSINGWPFAAVADTNMAIAGGAAMIIWVANIVAGYTEVAGQFANGSSAMTLTESGDNLGVATLQGGEIIATSQFRFHGHYRVA